MVVVVVAVIEDGDVVVVVVVVVPVVVSDLGQGYQVGNAPRRVWQPNAVLVDIMEPKSKKTWGYIVKDYDLGEAQLMKVQEMKNCAKNN